MSFEVVHPVFADQSFKRIHHSAFSFEHAVAVIAHFHYDAGVAAFQPFGPVADVAVGVIAVRGTVVDGLQMDVAVQLRTGSCIVLLSATG